MEYYSAMRKKGILSFATMWMILRAIIYAKKKKKTEKGKFYVFSLTFQILRKSQTHGNKEEKSLPWSRG